jgi:hypothetical protein
MSGFLIFSEMFCCGGAGARRHLAPLPAGRPPSAEPTLGRTLHYGRKNLMRPAFDLRRAASWTARLSAACCALAAGTAGPARASALPKIANVTFTAGQPDHYTATITGLNFGPVPPGIPCNGCAPEQVQVVDLAHQPTNETINVTGWTNTSITVTGITADPGDAARVAVYNQTAGNVAAWGGLVSPNSGVPVIKSIQVAPNGAQTMITITGSGFGAAPPEVGQDTTSPFLVLTDWNKNFPSVGNGGSFPWNGGFCGAHNCDEITATYQSWSDSQVVIAGFGSAYGGDGGGWVVTKRDAFCVGIWPSSSTSDGTTGGAVACTRVGKK